jgi:predicted transcriptional regulator
METTVTFEPQVLELVQTVARQRQQTVSEVLTEAILDHFKNIPLTEPVITRGPTGLPEIRLGRPITLEEVREVIEDED